MTSTLTIEMRRGATVESSHVIDAAVVDAGGVTIAEWGDAGRLVFPRSAIKAVQALPLVESGACEAFGVSDAELALACSSHGGQREHVRTAASWLARIGAAEKDLECGVHIPMHARSAQALVRAARTPGPLHNCCSGKHCGFIATAIFMGEAVSGYRHADHPVQQRVMESLTALTGGPCLSEQCGPDGCGIPAYAFPLRSLARAAARMADPDTLGLSRARAARRITDAIASQPFMIAGDERLCTALIAASAGVLLPKFGAEGVFMVMVRTRGWGLALKARDGATRGAEAAVIEILKRLGLLEDIDQQLLQPWLAAELLNNRGEPAGRRDAAFSADARFRSGR